MRLKLERWLQAHVASNRFRKNFAHLGSSGPAILRRAVFLASRARREAADGNLPVRDR